MRFEAGDVSKDSEFYDNVNPIDEPFTVTVDVPDDAKQHAVDVSVWDEDTHWNPQDPDDQLDIAPNDPGKLAWSATVSVDTERPITTEGVGDSEDDFDASIEFTILTNC